MLIDKGVTVRGSFQVEGDLEIMGILEGKVLVSGRLVIGEGGSLTGEATCSGGSVAGRLTGVLTSDEVVTVGQGATVSGRIIAPALDFGTASGADQSMRAAADEPSRPAREPARAPAREPEPGHATQSRDRAARSQRPPTVTGDRSQVLVSPGAILRDGR